MSNFKRILVALLAIVLLSVMTGCASYDAQVDENVVEVEGYHFIKADKKLVGCHGAGKSGYGGSGNDMFNYPAGQRTLSFTGKSSEEEEDPFPVVTHDSQTLHQPGFIKFTLTSDCNALYQFHQKIGIKYRQQFGDNWWSHLLNDYLGVPIGNALTDAVAPYNWRDYYSDPQLRVKVENDIVPDVQQAVNQSLGSDKWITINSVTLAKPIASTTLTAGLESVQKAALENDAQKQRNLKVLTQYDTIKNCLNTGLDKQSCTLIFLSQNGADIPFVPVPQGGNINYAGK